MYSRLTEAALNELTILLRHSRRNLGAVYRLYSVGMKPQEIAQERGESDPRKVEDSMSALLILFGRKALPKRGHGRQKALAEAEHWLNSNDALSVELEEHFNGLLFQGKRTNVRKGYSPEPIAERHVRARRRNGSQGRQAGIYVLTRQEYLLDYRAGRSKKLLMKIGYSDSVWERIESAQTWDPEPLELLRVFLTDDPKLLEKKFHVVFDTLNQQYQLGGGMEWFASSLSLVDAVAEALELRDCAHDVEAS